MIGDRKLPSSAGANEVDAFVREVGKLPAAARAGGRGRLLFAMDATASREPTWDHACAIQGEMFVAADTLGGLDVRLAFYRGFEEFKVSKWTSDGRELARLMSAVRCLAGRTQIARLLSYAADQRRESRLDAVVFVGDCCEEDVDAVGHDEGRLVRGRNRAAPGDRLAVVLPHDRVGGERRREARAVVDHADGRRHLGQHVRVAQLLRRDGAPDHEPGHQAPLVRQERGDGRRDGAFGIARLRFLQGGYAGVLGQAGDERSAP